MVEVGKFVDGLKAAGVEFFAGVPDSLLKSFCAYVTDTCGENHVIAANEGGAVGLAAGYYLATGKPGYVSRQVPTPAEAIAAIHADGGVAVWAHPFTRGNYTVAQTRRIAVELKDLGLDGIEAYYPLHTATQTRNVLKIAGEIGLLVSGGSDFHGMRFRNVELGTGYGKLCVPDALLAPLRAASRQG